MILMRVSRWLPLIFLIACVSACAPRASEGDFDSDNPASKLYAVRAAGESGDVSRVPRLVELLDHDDPAVRMMTINALERLTGERMGYNPYDPPHDRQEAIARWTQAVQEGRWAGKPRL